MIPTRARCYLRTEGGIVHLCAWCADQAETTKELQSHGVRVSHGICAAHRDQQRQQISSNTNTQKEI